MNRISKRSLAVWTIAALLASACWTARVHADAAGDLAAGQAALAAGDLDKALPLLVGAAENLPRSVEAQLALARARLAAGELDKALEQYRAVLKLSPDHAEAKRLVEALTGRRETLDQKLVLVRALIDAEEYGVAMATCRGLLAEAVGPAQRLAVRMALCEATLWQRFGHLPLNDFLETMNLARGDEASADPARVMAAMAMVADGPAASARAVKLLEGVGVLRDETWKRRAAVVTLLAKLGPKSADEVAAALAGPLSAVPAGGYRDGLLDRLTDELAGYARAAAERGDSPAALRILWPMASAAPFPATREARAALLPGKIDCSGGWLVGRADRKVRGRLVGALMDVAGQCVARRDDEATLAELVLANDFLAQLQSADEDRDWAVSQRLAVAEKLAALSRPAPERKEGTPLSRADELQRLILADAAPAAGAAEQGRIVNLLVAQVERYRKAGDVKTGLAAFVRPMPAGESGSDLAVMPAMPPGAERDRWFLFLAQQYAGLGAEAFAKAAATLDADANAKLNDDDVAALHLAAMVEAGWRSDNGAAVANGVAGRYASAEKWAAAEAATKAFYATRPGDAGKWALIGLAVRRASADEAKILSAHLKLGDKLDARLAEALASAAAIVKADPTDANKARTAGLAEGLLARYGRLERPDLAEAVIAAVATWDRAGQPDAGRPAAPAAGSLADWAMIARARLLEVKAQRELAVAAQQFDGVKKIELNANHAAELKLLAELLARFPISNYAPSAVAAVERISNAYVGYKAFDVAERVLADLVKAYPKIAPIERLRWAVVRVAAARAASAFAERKDKGEKAPEVLKLSDEYAALLKAVGEFLSLHPTGPYAAAAEEQVLAVARVYGQADAWPIAREVLARFAPATPNFRDPALLNLWEAATYLGELDRGHGLGLLALPQPVRPMPLGETRTSSGRVGGGYYWADPSDGEESGAMGGRYEMDRLGRERPTAETPAPPGEPMATSAPRRPTPPMVQPPPPANQPMSRLQAADEIHDVPGQSLAMIRQSEMQQARRIAMMNDNRGGQQGQRAQQDAQQIRLPSGPVLSEAEMKRQDASADAAYGMLIELVKAPAGGPAGLLVDRARGEVLWLIGFFEGRLRANRAAELLDRFIADRPTDPARIALAYRGVNDRLVWAAQVQPTDRIDQKWIDARHELFESARAAIEKFATDYAEPDVWPARARLLAVASFQQEAELVARVSAPRAAGLLARSADELLALSRSQPDHPDTAGFPGRLWSIADRLTQLGQRDQAVYVLGQLPIRFPTDRLATQAVRRMADLYATNLSAPLRAVETYQEYLALAGDNAQIRSQIYSIGQQLSGKQRYLEALHVFGVFVDSFPTDPRAAEALLAVGQTHQANEAWADAISAYQRILDEYGSSNLTPRVRLATAECQIQLSQWKQARKIYADYAAQYSSDGNARMARERIETLKSLDRYQTLLADEQVTRNKDDAQFQIGRIVLDRLANPVKAIAEFRKVVSGWPKSHLADDAQFEIGKALVGLGRLDEARAELAKVPADYPTSPLADDALYMIGQSYEQQATRLAAVTLKKARDIAFERGQRGAYQEFQKQQFAQSKILEGRRKELKAAGKGAELANEEAYNAFRYNASGSPELRNIARKAEQEAETESALQVANRQDRINEAYRSAVSAYERAAKDFPLGDATDESLLRMANIFETQLKDRKRAMETYQQVVKFFPGTPVAENAAWKVAQFYEAEGNYDEAVKAYRDFIRNYPASGKVPDAQYAMAEALEQLGRWVEAMDAYQTFRDKFAKHPKADQALEQIQWIKAYRK